MSKNMIDPGRTGSLRAAQTGTPTSGFSNRMERGNTLLSFSGETMSFAHQMSMSL